MRRSRQFFRSCSAAQSKSPDNCTSRLFGQGLNAINTALWRPKESGGERVIPWSAHEGDRLSITRNEIQPRRGSADLHQMPQDLANFLRLGDHGKNPHLGGTPRTDQWVHFVNLGNEPGPGGAAFLGRDRTWRFFRAVSHRLGSLLAFGLPAGRSEAEEMGHIRPLALGSGRIAGYIAIRAGGYVASIRARIGLQKRSRLYP